MYIIPTIEISSFRDSYSTVFKDVRIDRRLVHLTRRYQNYSPLAILQVIFNCNCNLNELKIKTILIRSRHILFSWYFDILIIIHDYRSGQRVGPAVQLHLAGGQLNQEQGKRTSKSILIWAMVYLKWINNCDFRDSNQFNLYLRWKTEEKNRSKIIYYY